VDRSRVRRDGRLQVRPSGRGSILIVQGRRELRQVPLAIKPCAVRNPAQPGAAGGTAPVAHVVGGSYNHTSNIVHAHSRDPRGLANGAGLPGLKRWITIVLPSVVGRARWGWHQLVGDVTIGEFLRTVGPQDVRAAMFPKPFSSDGLFAAVRRVLAFPEAHVGDARPATHPDALLRWRASRIATFLPLTRP